MIVNTSAQSAVRISSETAAAFGLSADATPDDVLNILKAGVLHKTIGKYTKYSTVGALPVGATLSLNVNGKAWEFLVVHQGKPSDIYDNSCNGTWLLMKDIYENRVWDSNGKNIYESSEIHSYLNSTFLNLFESNIRDAIKQVKIPYRKNGGSDGTDQSGANGLSCKVFLPSGPEIGLAGVKSMPNDGAKLDYFNANVNTGADPERIAYRGSSAAQWVFRSPGTGTNYSVWFADTNGACYNNPVSGSYGIRPALVLSPDFPYEVYVDSDGNFYPEQEYITILSDVLGNVLSVGPKIAIGSYVGTGAYGAANPNSLTFDFAPKMVMVFRQTNYKGAAPGNLVNSNANNNYFVQLMDLLTTEYVTGRGFGDRFNDYPMGKKSADGKTILWYSIDGATHQLNESTDGTVYSYIAFG